MEALNAPRDFATVSKDMRDLVSAPEFPSKLIDEWFRAYAVTCEASLLQVAKGTLGLSTEQLVRSQAAALGALQAVEVLRQTLVYRPAIPAASSQQKGLV